MKRIAIPIETNELCQYGCGQTAKFKNGSDNLMCCERCNRCPTVRKRNSNAVSKAHAEGRCVSDFGGKEKRGWRRGRRFAVFEKGPVPRGGRTRKPALIDERGHKCEKCLLTEWLGKQITLELEHVDGDSQNNIRANLKLLCPNCHSQTSTWRRSKTPGKNERKRTVDEMKTAILSSKTLNECMVKLELKWGSAPTILRVMQEQRINFMS